MASLPARALPLPELLAVLVWGVSLRVCMEGSPLCVSLPDLSRMGSHVRSGTALTPRGLGGGDSRRAWWGPGSCFVL